MAGFEQCNEPTHNEEIFKGLVMQVGNKILKISGIA
jgi:hypothetical protein